MTRLCLLLAIEDEPNESLARLIEDLGSDVVQWVGHAFNGHAGSGYQKLLSHIPGSLAERPGPCTPERLIHLISLIPAAADFGILITQDVALTFDSGLDWTSVQVDIGYVPIIDSDGDCTAWRAVAFRPRLFIEPQMLQMNVTESLRFVPSRGLLKGLSATTA